MHHPYSREQGLLWSTIHPSDEINVIAITIHGLGAIDGVAAPIHHEVPGRIGPHDIPDCLKGECNLTAEEHGHRPSVEGIDQDEKVEATYHQQLQM